MIKVLRYHVDNADNVDHDIKLEKLLNDLVIAGARIISVMFVSEWKEYSSPNDDIYPDYKRVQVYRVIVNKAPDHPYRGLDLRSGSL